ncbi:MAG: hypothetical protein KF781_02570 [Chitinophagaceae bacterium]|nr:hypothetical protein [Chitinophagaceae bacterium]MCW5904394.1 hypothetical protein [Chitinophagaceae bacterium]
MKQLFLAFILVLVNSFSYAQKQKTAIEIKPYMRWDWYPEFTYAINSISTYKTNITGTSWGIDAAYKIPIHKTIYLKAGLAIIGIRLIKLMITIQGMEELIAESLIICMDQM